MIIIMQKQCRCRSNDGAMCSQIDVGKCSGVCDEEGVGGSGEEAEGTSDSSATPEMTCLATRTRQVAVEGPNGERYWCTLSLSRIQHAIIHSMWFHLMQTRAPTVIHIQGPIIQSGSILQIFIT